MGGPWLFWMAAIVFALGGVTLVLWALFGDRARGRRRCPKCWYDLAAPGREPPTLRCSECGHEAKSDRALLRTRRRWKWVAAAALPLLLAAFLAVQPKVQRDGWVSIVPTTIVILALNIDGMDWAWNEVPARMQIEVEHPAAAGTMDVPHPDAMWRWQWRMAGDAFVRHIEQAGPGFRREMVAWLAWVVEATGRLQPCYDAIVRALDDPDPNVRVAAAIYVVGGEDLEETTERLRAMMGDPAPMARGGAVAGLRLVVHYGGAEFAVPVLLDALGNDDPTVRSLAIGGLRSAVLLEGHDEGAITPAIEALLQDPQGDVRQWGSHYLVARHLIDPDAIARARDFLASPDEHIRTGAMWALFVEIKPRPEWLTEAVLASLEDESEDVRVAALMHFQSLTVEDVRGHGKALERLMESEEQRIVLHAVHLLEALGQE